MKARALAAALLAGGCGLALGLTGDFAVFLLTRVCVFAAAAVSLNLLFGYGGQLSLSQAALLMVGAYGQGLLLRAGVPWPLALAGAVAVTALAGAAVSLLATRARGPTFAILTLGLQIVSERVAAQWTTVTGGRMGLPVPPAPVSGSGYLALSAALVGAAVAAAAFMARSAAGRRWVALRDDEDAARCLGIGLVRTRAQLFSVSGALAGLAGALSVHPDGVVLPSQLTLSTSIELVIMVVVGGVGSLGGSVLGAAGVVLLDQLLAPLSAWHAAVFGALLLAAVFIEPRGLAALSARWRAR